MLLRVARLTYSQEKKMNKINSFKPLLLACCTLFREVFSLLSDFLKKEPQTWCNAGMREFDVGARDKKMREGKGISLHHSI